MIIDCHTHLGLGDIKDDDVVTGISLDTLLTSMERNGVGKAIAFAPNCIESYHKDNDLLIDYATKTKGKIIPFLRIKGGNIHPRTKRRMIALLIKGHKIQHDSADYIKPKLDLGIFKGIKINPVIDELPSDEVLSLIASYSIPILFHCGEGVDLEQLINNISVRHNIKMIIAHFGGYPANRWMYENTIKLAKDNKNIFIDTAAMFFPYYLKKASEICPEKILFGSDAPVISQAAGIAIIKDTQISDEIKEMIFYKNIKQLLNLD